jgi:MFS transporter, putative metabolite:H+ symporter
MDVSGVTAGAIEQAALQLDRLRLTRLHWAIVILCALGLGFDVIEAALGYALSAAFSSPPYQVAPYQLSLLLGSIFAGGAIGAPLLGWLADRSGRRLALSLSLFALTLTSLMAAASPDVAWLTFFRFLSGMALGAYPPLMVAYLSDVLPAARRGMLILLVGAIGFLGAPAVVLLIRTLTPMQPFGLEGWRCALIIGAAGAGAVATGFRMLPESPRWLLAAARFDAAIEAYNRFSRHAGCEPVQPGTRPAAPVIDAARASFWFGAARAHRPRTSVLCALYFLSPWATVGFPLLSGAVLVEKGFRVADSLLYLGVSLLGPSIGVLAGAAFIDRVERRTTLALSAAAMAVTGVWFATSNAPALLMAAGTAFNLLGAIHVGALSIYGAELFPTALRATVSSTAWAVNRVTSALVPLALLPLLKSTGPLAMTGVIALAMCASAALVLAFGDRGLSGKPVE